MKPLLAHVYEPHRVTYPCFVQPKLNGIRALYQNGHFQSRDELPFPPGLLDHLSRPLLETFAKETILDGELYVHGWPLQRINGAVTPVRQKPTEDTLLVEYWIFDSVDYNLSFLDRFVKVCQTGNGLPGINFVTTVEVKDNDWDDTFYSNVVADGFEGIMYRLGDCPYTTPKQHWAQAGPLWNVKPKGNFLSDKNNRCWHLLKRKSWCDDEFDIVDTIEGEGKLKGMLGAIVCQTPSNKRFSVGSGFTDADRQYFWALSPIGRRVKVKYLCLSSDGIPLNPTLLAIL